MGNYDQIYSFNLLYRHNLVKFIIWLIDYEFVIKKNPFHFSNKFWIWTLKLKWLILFKFECFFEMVDILLMSVVIACICSFYKIVISINIIGFITILNQGRYRKKCLGEKFNRIIIYKGFGANCGHGGSLVFLQLFRWRNLQEGKLYL